MTKPFFWTLLGILFLMPGCKDLVQDDFTPMDPMPVVNGFLIQDSLVKIHVSIARGLDDAPLEVVENANVSLAVNGSWVEDLAYQYEGWFRGNTVVEPGNIYTCQVNVPGYETLIATDSIPFESVITDIKHINIAGITEEGITHPAIHFSFKNDPQQDQYYQFIIYLVREFRDEIYRRPAWLHTITDPVLLSEGLQLSAFSNQHIPTEEYRMQVPYNTGSYSCSGDSCWTNLQPVIFEFRSISKHYYEHLRQLKLYEEGRAPEFGSSSYGVFPLHSNVENGAGIFAGYSTLVLDTIFPNR